MPLSRRLYATAAVCTAMAMLTTAPPADAATRRFPGRGWGHGAGMAQWGARGLAHQGKTASEILKHYYTGIDVQRKTLPSEIRVGLLQERAEIYVEGDGAFGLYDSGGTKKANGKAGERWTIRPKSGRLEVLAPGASTPKFTSAPPVTVRYEATDTLVTLPQTKHTYKRGRIDIGINPSTGKTRAILIVGFEQYLYGLGEMPASWHHEALETQVIAARTYALEKVNRLGQQRSVCNCAVYGTTADQVYAGVAHEVPRWVDAVNTTAGLVATYGGKPIQAYYSSSSGGFTEGNENVFGGTPLPYLRAVCDPGDYFAGDNPHANWMVAMDDAEIETRLRSAGHNTGPIRSITYPAPRGASGRVIGVKDETHGGVKVVGTIDDARLSGSVFRSALGLKSTLIGYNVAGGIRLRYDALMCKPGAASRNEYAWKAADGTVRGRAQDFANGRLIFDKNTTKVLYVQKAFLAALDSARSKGLALDMATADGKSITGGKLATFENGNIYVSSKYGGRVVYGAILKKYVSTGGPKKWGFPTTGELSAPNSGRSQRFEKARIYWSPKYDARTVFGAILAKYLELGGASGKLGLPKSDEYDVTTGRRQDFLGGYITWDAVTGRTSHTLT